MKTYQPSSKFLSDGLALISHCPFCQESLDPLEAKIVGEGKQSHLLHIRCRFCRHSMLAVVVVSESGISSFGLLTDCSSEDVMRFRESRKINEDDVLDAHLQLRDDKAFFKALQN